MMNLRGNSTPVVEYLSGVELQGDLRDLAVHSSLPPGRSF